MSWWRFAAVVLGAGFVTSMTDWLFAGDWIHRRWTYPEVWRQGEGRAIALTSPLPFVTCAVFAYLALRLGLHTARSLAKLAVAVWIIGPLPVILTVSPPPAVPVEGVSAVIDAGLWLPPVEPTAPPELPVEPAPEWSAHL